MYERGGGVTDRVAGLSAAVASVAELDPASLPAGVQLDLLRELWPVLCRLDATVTRVVGVVNAQGSAAQEGAVSTVAWLRSRLHAGGAAPRVQDVLVHEHGWSIRLDKHTGIVTATDPGGRQLDIVSHPRAHSP
jgi:hypothetical protein